MTEQEQDDVIDLLASGFGVEDIALRLQLDLLEVRRFITKLRADGLMDEIYGGQP